MFKDILILCSSVPRLKILKFFLIQNECKALAPVVASTIGVPLEIVNRELRALARQGILVSRTQGKKVFWSANTEHQLAPALREFLDTATQPDDALIAKTFRGVSGVTLLVVAGLLSGEDKGLLDVLIVTRKPHDAKIAHSIRALERLSGVPLRYAVLERGEYIERLEARDRMLRDALEFKHRVIIDRR